MATLQSGSHGTRGNHKRFRDEARNRNARITATTIDSTVSRAAWGFLGSEESVREGVSIAASLVLVADMKDPDLAGGPAGAEQDSRYHSPSEADGPKRRSRSARGTYRQHTRSAVLQSKTEMFPKLPNYSRKSPPPGPRSPTRPIAAV